MPVKNKLVALMGKKQAETNQIVSASVVAREVGLTRQAIYKWMHNDVTEFRGEVVDRFCEYFNCEVDDLLYIDDSPEPAQ